MNSKRGKRQGNKYFPITETMSIAMKAQLDKFLADEKETELLFPSFLSAQERGFVHAFVAKLGLKSKSRGKGVNRYLTIYKREGSTIIQNDAKLILDSNMRCIISELHNAFPITSREKEELAAVDKERNNQLTVHKTLGQINTGIPLIPETAYNPDMMKFREKLPVYEQRHEIINAFVEHRVIIVAGATGSGKTTQVPQLILEHCKEQQAPARIYCTQPRRISAVAVAERVAAERCEKVGSSVGYQIRLESRCSPRTILTYCTNGVLLRTLMAGENALAGVTHVLVDEVHERDKFSDFLLIALRDAVPRFPDLRLVLMSATMDTQLFSRYFNNCPVVTIPGRLHEVQRFYLEDILKLTQYKSKKMVQAERELKKKLKTGQSYWKHLEGLKHNTDDSQNQNQAGNKEAEVTDSTQQADMDSFLDECFNDGSVDSFCQLLYMYLSEGVPADLGHARCGRTGLMAAAARGLTDTASQILRIGANPAVKDKSGKTAYDYAVENGHTECAAMLASFNQAEETPAKNTQEEENAADNFLLDVYHHSFTEDLIDHDLMLALVRHIHLNLPNGSILIFLPGYDDIITLRELILSCKDIASQTYAIFTLHSNMQITDQKKIFNPMPTLRKIIISTNIAETSITIDDVVYVIDSCKVKEKYYESNGGVCSLQCVWTSRACCQQRAGRAGRTKPGQCFHMCSKRRFKTLPINSVPEILRVPLQELCLHTKLLAPGNTPIADFLSKALEPPSFLAVRNAVSLLKTIGALTANEDLTEIGQLLLELTVEPKLGKSVLYACVLKCLDPVLTIVCCLSNKEPFQMSPEPEGRRRAAAMRRDLDAGSHSDHMVLLRAFQEWQVSRAMGTERVFCSRSMICGATMETVSACRAQILAQLRAAGLVRTRGHGDIKDVNAHSDKWYVVKAALVAGVYPALARVDRTTGTLRTAREARVALHPASVLLRAQTHARAHAHARDQPARELPADWLAYEELARVGRFCFVRCATLLAPLAVALLAGPLRLPPGALTQRANAPGLSSDSDSEAEAGPSASASAAAAPDSAVLAIDSWAAFAADASDALSVFYLRQKLSALVVRRLTHPARPYTPLDEQVLATVVQVLAADERNAGLTQPAGIGQRPRPIAMDSPSWRMRVEGDQHRPSFTPPAAHSHPHSHGHAHGHGQAPRNGQRAGWKSDGPPPGFSPQPHASAAPKPAGTKTMVANLEKYMDPADTTVRYFVAKADDLHTVENAQTTGTPYPFTPNVAKKLQKIKQEGGRAVVIFSCANAAKFTGAAAFFETGFEWLAGQPVPFHHLRHITNSLAGGARAVGARDGTELCGASGRALVAALVRRRPPPRAPRPIQKHAE